MDTQGAMKGAKKVVQDPNDSNTFFFVDNDHEDIDSEQADDNDEDIDSEQADDNDEDIDSEQADHNDEDIDSEQAAKTKAAKIKAAQAKADEDNKQYAILIPNAMYLTDEKIAQLCAYVLKDIVVSYSLKNGSYYAWDENVKLWINASQDYVLSLIMEKVPPIVEKVKNSFITELKELKSEDPNKEKTELSLKKIQILISQFLENITVAKRLTTRLCKLLYNKDFAELVNSSTEYLLPIKKGKVINLKTGKIRERKIKDYFFYECNIEYNSEAKCENVKKFLEDITLKDKELEDYLQYILGYCLTGSIDLRKFFIFHGELGANGKSTLMNMMEKILGHFYHTADKGVFTKMKQQNSGTAAPHLCNLRGKRVAAFPESGEEDCIDEQQIKTMTGNDTISARPLYKNEYITYKCEFKGILFTNHKPDVSRASAMWDRLVLVSFNCSFVQKEGKLSDKERKRDPRMMTKLLNSKNSLQAFFNWLLAGAKRFYSTEKGDEYKEPKSVSADTLKYKQEKDFIANFIEECLEPGDKEDKISASKLYNVYCEWHRKEKATPISQSKFGIEISKIIEKKKCSTMQYIGYKLRKDEDEDKNSGTTNQSTFYNLKHMKNIQYSIDNNL